jgi:hypothetical protein
MQKEKLIFTTLKKSNFVGLANAALCLAGK